MYKELNEKIYTTLCVLIIFSIVFFTISKLFNEKDISLIKDILGIASTVFTAFVAVYIFQGWVVQKKLESLSENAKERIPTIPNISLEILSFYSEISNLLTYMSIYKERPTNLLLSRIEEIVPKLYGHPFIEIAMNFDQSFKEIKSLMLLKEDIELYEAISKAMDDYRQLIYKEKILNRNVDIGSIDIKSLIEKNDELYMDAYQKLSAFYLRLFDYKNFNYRK